MPLLALAFTVACPFIFGHRLTLAFLFCVRTTIHVLFALVFTVAGYALLLLIVVDTYACSQPLADVLYFLGFILAALLAVSAGTMVAPLWLVRVFLPIAGVATAIFPVWLYVHHGLSGAWEAVYLWYLAGSLVGSISAARLVRWTVGHDRGQAGMRTA